MEEVYLFHNLWKVVEQKLDSYLGWDYCCILEAVLICCSCIYYEVVPLLAMAAKLDWKFSPIYCNYCLICCNCVCDLVCCLSAGRESNQSMEKIKF